MNSTSRSISRAGVFAVLLFPATNALGGLLDSPESYFAPGTPVSSDFVLGPTTPGKWGSPILGTGASVTWSIMPAGVSMALEGASDTVSLDTIFPAGYFAQIQAAFDAWSAVANITFSYVTPDNAVPFGDGGTIADIRIGAHPMDGPSGTLAHGFYPPSNFGTAAGDIHFDSSETWKIGFGGAGFDIFQVTAHEIGHAIGLNHTQVPGSLMNPFYTETFSGLQADDIAGAVFLYGPAVPEASTWFAGVMLAFGGVGLWRSRRGS